jgi:hypothetical protein
MHFAELFGVQEESPPVHPHSIKFVYADTHIIRLAMQASQTQMTLGMLIVSTEKYIFLK